MTRKRYLTFVILLILLIGTVTVTAQDSQTPQRGGTAVIALIQEPGGLNPFFISQSGADLGGAMVQEPLFLANAAGEYQPLLAAEIPTLENGGISEDFLTITYRLREGITWSDGEPFTAEDLAFTYEVFSNPESVTQAGSAYFLIESVEVVDPLTLRVQMSDINPGYLELWESVLAEHMFDSSAATNEHPQARTPLGTGPFVISEWVTGDRIILERNPNYWRNPEQPYLDGITILITPERELTIASFLEGDYDTVFFVVAGDLPVLTQAVEQGAPIEVALQATPGRMEWLWLNMTDPANPGQAPHPVLGDPAIREAMDYGIDRQSIIDNVLGGFGYLQNAYIYAGWAAVDMPPVPYDPARASQILDEAGWITGADGIREKDGVRASLRFQTIAGDLTRELYQQIIQQNMRDIGIELQIENVPSNTIFGSYEEEALLARANYDIVMSRDGYLIDPINWAALFTTDLIPSAENPNGFTYSHWSNPEFDRLVAEAASTLDQQNRIDLYGQTVDIFAQERPAIPLYSSGWGWAWNTRLQGVDVDYWDGMWYSSASWYLNEAM